MDSDDCGVSSDDVYEVSDEDYERSYNSYSYDSFEANVRLYKHGNQSVPNDNCESGASSGIVTSLLDLSAKIASLYYTYNHVEHIYSRIPEPIAKSFMRWSFPRNRNIISKYFGTPSRYIRRIIFDDVMQIGFQVSGYCEDEGKRICVSLYIDRCVITSASCSCKVEKFLCDHIRSLALYRFDHADAIPIHLPISDSLNTLNQEQLLYLVKFIINKHSNVLLLNANDITNELLDENSEKNRIPGAPDPTAGGDMDNDPLWYNGY